MGKIIELEEKFTHLEHLIEELNNIVFRQTQHIDKQEEMIKHLLSQLEYLKDKQESGSQTINERPPHY